MSARRLFAAFVAVYGLLLLGWLLSPAFRESFVGQIVAIPPFSIYVLEHFGIPGLTDRTDCNWMWCRPTILGIVLASGVWLVAAWLVAAGIVRVIRSRRRPAGERPGPVD